MLVKTYAAAVNGVEADLIDVEVNITNGINFYMVGLPDNAVKESRERMTTAIINSGYSFPHRQITINLAPADVRKEGTGYDLPLAVGILAANGSMDGARLSEFVFMGELSLDGTLRSVNGVLPIAIMAKQKGFKGIILPKENAPEASVVGDGLEVYGAECLRDVVNFFNGCGELERTMMDVQHDFFDRLDDFDFDFKDVCGQETAKRALEVAVAGGHNLIMIGSPGSGKSMMAKCIPSIMPRFTFDESLETTKIYSVSGLLPKNASLVTKRPFRSPHNNVSNVALLGGGSNPKPGEISLAHNGVLFLDELPQYSRNALEELRQPMEDRMISISRAKSSAEFPANFMLVAAMNPCPCGNYGNPNQRCSCSENEVKRYMSKISGPLFDRIDIQLEIQPIDTRELSQYDRKGEPSHSVRQRVERAREIQRLRFASEKSIHSNAQMEKKHCDMYCRMTQESIDLLNKAMDRLRLSARGFVKVLKVARTIADIEESQDVEPHHVKEAISYRALDRGNRVS